MTPYPVEPFAAQVAFQSEVYRTKVAQIDQRVQERKRQYEQRLPKPPPSRTYEGLYVAVAGVLFSWKVAAGAMEGIDPIAAQVSAVALSIFSLYLGFQFDKGQDLGEWKRAFFVEEMSGLNEDRFSLTGLIASLEEDPDLLELQRLEQLINERILKIRNLVKEVLCRNPMDLSSEDDPDLRRGPNDPDQINTLIGHNNAPDSLLGALIIEDEGESAAVFRTAIKRGALIAVSNAILEQSLCVLPANPIMGLGGVAAASSLLYLERHEMVLLKSDVLRTSPVCKLILIALPTLGIASPLFLLKSWSVSSLSHAAIGNIALSAMGGLSRRVQHNKRKIDAYALKGNAIYWEGMCYKENGLNRESTDLESTKTAAKEIAQLRKKVAFLESLQENKQ
jgi:hypothetical protein